MNSLTSNTRYQYFVRSKSGSNRGGWIGPYSIFTAVAGAPSYNYGFDNTDGFSFDGWSGAWSTNATAGNPQFGSQMIFSNSSTTVGTPTNRWLFSRPIYLEANSTNVIKFYLRNFGGANPQSVKMTIGNEPLVASQTNTLWTSSTIANATWTEYTVNYSPTSTGVYYLGFHHFTPGLAGSVSLGLDTFSLTSTLSSENFETYNFEIYPNPATTMLNIANTNNVEIKNISVTDINGRVVKNETGSLTQINVSDLNAGVYFVTIEAAEGKTTKKFIKQ
jgi:hypothetical protein